MPNELHVFSEEKGEQPFIISQNFTFYMHEKSKLRAFLENWRGKKFSEEESAAFDIAKLIGVPAMLNVMHNTKAGRTYANVGAASRLPKGLECPPQVIPPVVFSLAEFDQRVFDALPDWMREEVANSDEYRNLVSKERDAVDGGAAAQAHGDDVDDIPF